MPCRYVCTWFYTRVSVVGVYVPIQRCIKISRNIPGTYKFNYTFSWGCTFRHRFVLMLYSTTWVLFWKGTTWPVCTYLARKAPSYVIPTLTQRDLTPVKTVSHYLKVVCTFPVETMCIRFNNRKNRVIITIRKGQPYTIDDTYRVLRVYIQNVTY